MTAALRVGDCLEIMPTLDAESVDAVITDPPYGLGFMGKGWDSFAPASVERNKLRDTRTQKRRGLYAGKESDAPSGAMAAARYDGRRDDEFEAFMFAAAVDMLRVAKPGAHLVLFGSTRRHHRAMCGIEDAGWEIRDTLSYLFGSGFPKSRNIGDGWGTALKPGWEPIILARKPFPGTVSANVEANGTGALNIDACRINSPAGDGVWGSSNETVSQDRKFNASPDGTEYRSEKHPLGRWPANVVLDEEAAAMLDEQSGTLTSGANPTRRGSNKFANTCGDFAGQEECEPARGVDVGGASRFYYCAKASRSERDAGLYDLAKKSGGANVRGFTEDVAKGVDRNLPVHNHHPTVKPLALMQWLCRLVTPKGGLILDPFCGSGSTGRAAVAEGFSFIGIEKIPEYAAIARARIGDYAPLFNDPEAA